MDFVGRESELLLLRCLDELREGGRGSLVGVRGRCRVGKSRLAEEFARASGCPYVYQEPSLEAILQKVWDRNWQDAPILVLLIGSDEATMRALAERGRPLYDRLREMAVRPLSLAAVGELLGLSPADLDVRLGPEDLIDAWRR